VPDNPDRGYDKEEEYFYRKNQEMLAKKRTELDEQRKAQEAAQLREVHWMRCPKCGQQMAEEDRAGIKIDRCSGCGGVFFDAGELDLLLKAEGQSGFLSSLRKRISG
jgi:uncharacterized protein